MPPPAGRPVPSFHPTQERRSFLKRIAAFVAGGAVAAGVKNAWAETQAPQGIDPFIGEIMLVAWPAPTPPGWAECSGQVLSISQNTALFSLLGTTYGGNGITTFALPDLRGRAPIHRGQGPGLINRNMGEAGGAEQVTLITSQMPQHSHALLASAGVGTQDTPVNGYPARDAAGTPAYAASGAGVMAPGAMAQAGANLPHENMSPFLCMRYLIALQGIYPSSGAPQESR
jgi:microcystin-dependent protein